MKSDLILQLVNMGIGAFLQSKHSAGEERATTKADIKAYILASTQTAESIGKLVIVNRKAFNSDIGKMVDSIDAMLKHSEWK